MTTPTRPVAGLEVELTLLARHQLRSAQAAETALDRSAYQLLSRLEHGAMSQRGLAEAFQLDQSTVNRQIAALRDKGLVERVGDPHGGPARLVHPTAEGLRLLRADRRLMQDQLDRVLAEWSPGEVDRLRRLLERFNTSIETAQGTPWPRPGTGSS